jgi:tight adherence protein C
METLLAFVSPDPAAGGTMLFGAVFFTVMFMFFVGFGATRVANRRADIRNRIMLDRAIKEDGGALAQDWESAPRSLRFQSLAESSALLADVERSARSGEKETEKTKLQRDLGRAGYFGANRVLWFHVIRFGLGIGLPALALVALPAFGVALHPSTRNALLCTLAGAGFFFPARWLAYRQGVLHQQCRDGFPDFLDLMVVCTEAGLAPRAAIDRIARELAQTYPYLGANLYLMCLELRAGVTLAEAIANLGRRTALEDVNNLGSLLQQTEQLGTSMGEALRVYSEEMRDKRMARAEEKAHALPVKLTVPLGIFVFPVMLVVIGLPVFLRIKAAMFQ